MKRNPKKKVPACKSRRIYGFRVVQEYLREKPHEIQTLYLLPSFSGTETETLARQANLLIQYESPAFFTSLTEGGVHQGIAAKMREFPYVSLQTILEKQKEVLLILDGILDPRNLGALLRTAEAVGVGGVIMSKDRSASLSDVAEKVAAGATAYLSICRVENLARSLDAVKTAGYWVVGLSPDAQMTLYDLNAPEKIAVVLGSEEKGLRSLTKQGCDFLVALPMEGKIQSLNVSVAGAVTLYEFLRRRTKARITK
jgi:23S rRNA (guanosine2251-2'-O)-methyltransferase